MGSFKPKWVKCVLNTDSYKYECTTPHKVMMDKKEHVITNTYRFTGKPLLYLIKDEDDYNEIIANPKFIDYVEPEEKPESMPSETSKERKLREQAENEAAKADKETEMKTVPAAQTDGIDSITERPEAD